jgi:hypothetical protein
MEPKETERNPTSDKTTKCLVCAGTGIMELRVEDGACQLTVCDVCTGQGKPPVLTKPWEFYDE